MLQIMMGISNVHANGTATQLTTEVSWVIGLAPKNHPNFRGIFSRSQKPSSELLGYPHGQGTEDRTRKESSKMVEDGVPPQLDQMVYCFYNMFITSQSR